MWGQGFEFYQGSSQTLIDKSKTKQLAQAVILALIDNIELFIAKN